MTNEEMMQQMLQVMQSMQKEIEELKSNKTTSKAEVKAEPKAEVKEEKKNFADLSFSEQVEVENKGIEYFVEHNKADDMKMKKCDASKGVTFMAVFTSKWKDKKTGKAMESRRIVVRLFDKAPNYGELVAKFAEIGCKEYYDKWNRKPLITKAFDKELFDKIVAIVGSVMKGAKPTTQKAETPKVEEVEEVEEVEDNTTDELEEEDVVEQVTEIVKPKAKKTTTKEPTPSLKTANNIANFAKDIFAKANED